MADPPEPPRYRAIQVDPPPSGPFATLFTQAFGINCKGETVGSTNHSPHQSGLLWLPSGAYGLPAGSHRLEANEPGVLTARSINTHGRVAGARHNWNIFQSHLYFWDLPSHTTGAIEGESLHEVAWQYKFPSINDDDVLIGTQIIGSNALSTAYRLPWDPVNGPGPIELLHPEPFSSESHNCKSEAIAIGASGLVVGHGFCSDPCWPNCIAPTPCGSFDPWESEARGAYWPANSNVGPLLDYLSVLECPDYCIPLAGLREPRGVNSANRIVGVAKLPDGSHGPDTCPNEAVIWLTPGAPAMTLPLPPGHVANQPTRANAISDVTPDGMVYIVGDNPQTRRAIIWWVHESDIAGFANWQGEDLNEITDVRDTDFLILREATGVNTMGWISGWGIVDDFPEEFRAFVLVPISGPDACLGDISGPLGVPDGRVGVADLLELLNSWGDCPSNPSTACWADLNGDGFVGVADLLILLANWGNCNGNCSITEAASLQQELNAAGLTQQNWQDLLNVLGEEPLNEQLRWICWFERYMTRCEECRPCRGNDPFAQ